MRSRPPPHVWYSGCRITSTLEALLCLYTDVSALSSSPLRNTSTSVASTLAQVVNARSICLLSTVVLARPPCASECWLRLARDQQKGGARLQSAINAALSCVCSDSPSHVAGPYVFRPGSKPVAQSDKRLKLRRIVFLTFRVVQPALTGSDRC